MGEWAVSAGMDTWAGIADSRCDPWGSQQLRTLSNAPASSALPCRPSPLATHPDDGFAPSAATAFISSPNKLAAMAALSQLPHVQTALLNQTLTDQQFQASWLRGELLAERATVLQAQAEAEAQQSVLLRPINLQPTQRQSDVDSQLMLSARGPASCRTAAGSPAVDHQPAAHLGPPHVPGLGGGPRPRGGVQRSAGHPLRARPAVR